VVPNRLALGVEVAGRAVVALLCSRCLEGKNGSNTPVPAGWMLPTSKRAPLTVPLGFLLRSTTAACEEAMVTASEAMMNVALIILISLCCYRLIALPFLITTGAAISYVFDNCQK
jgi:hypothetical protein